MDFENCLLVLATKPLFAVTALQLCSPHWHSALVYIKRNTVKCYMYNEEKEKESDQ